MASGKSLPCLTTRRALPVRRFWNGASMVRGPWFHPRRYCQTESCRLGCEKGGAMPDSVSAKCPKCGQEYDADKELLGRKVECPGCNTEFVVGLTVARPSPATEGRTAGSPVVQTPAGQPSHVVQAHGPPVAVRPSANTTTGDSPSAAKPSADGAHGRRLVLCVESGDKEELRVPQPTAVRLEAVYCDVKNRASTEGVISVVLFDETAGIRLAALKISHLFCVIKCEYRPIGGQVAGYTYKDKTLLDSETPLKILLSFLQDTEEWRLCFPQVSGHLKLPKPGATTGQSPSTAKPSIVEAHGRRLVLWVEVEYKEVVRVQQPTAEQVSALCRAVEEKARSEWTVRVVLGDETAGVRLAWLRAPRQNAIESEYKPIKGETKRSTHDIQDVSDWDTPLRILLSLIADTNEWRRYSVTCPIRTGPASAEMKDSRKGDTIHFVCPECHRPLRVRDLLAARDAECAECGAQFVVPHLVLQPSPPSGPATGREFAGCPGCGQKYPVDARKHGNKMVQCGRCGSVYLVNAPCRGLPQVSSTPSLSDAPYSVAKVALLWATSVAFVALLYWLSGVAFTAPSLWVVFGLIVAIFATVMSALPIAAVSTPERLCDEQVPKMSDEQAEECARDCFRLAERIHSANREALTAFDMDHDFSQGRNTLDNMLGDLRELRGRLVVSLKWMRQKQCMALADSTGVLLQIVRAWLKTTGEYKRVIDEMNPGVASGAVRVDDLNTDYRKAVLQSLGTFNEQRPDFGTSSPKLAAAITNPIELNTAIATALALMERDAQEAGLLVVVKGLNI